MTSCNGNNIIRHIFITVLAFCIVGVLAMIAVNTSFLHPASRVVKEFSMTDAYYQILQETGVPDTNTNITIVDMSDLYSRKDLAVALQQIEECKPKSVGVDVVFEGLKEDTLGDEMIAQVASEYDNIVFSYRLLDYENDDIGFATAVHSFFADSIKVNEGFTNIQRDLYGGIKRTLSLNRRCMGKDVPSFILKVADVDAKDYDSDDVSINFTLTKFTVVQPDSILTHPELIKGKTVLFGAMKDETDMHYTPLGKMAGTELIAYSVQTLQEHNEVWKMPKWMLIAMSFVLVLFTQAGYEGYSSFAKNRKNKAVRFVLSSSFTKSILVFLWLAFLGWASYVVFFKYNVSVNLGWALSAMAFLSLSRNFYDECATAIKTK